jgi:hypothetical protein
VANSEPGGRVRRMMSFAASVRWLWSWQRRAILLHYIQVCYSFYDEMVHARQPETLHVSLATRHTARCSRMDLTIKGVNALPCPGRLRS